MADSEPFRHGRFAAGRRLTARPTFYYLHVPAITPRNVAKFVAATCFVLATTVLLLADRSVSLVGTVHGFVVAAGRGIEQTLNIDVVDRSEIPGTTEQWGHAALWGSGMVLFGWLFRSRVPLAITALWLAGTSVAFEVAQPSLSTNRRFEPSDATANITGILIAILLLAPIVWYERRTIALAHVTR